MDYRPDVSVLVIFVRRLCDSRGLSVEGCGGGTVESSDPREDRRLVPEPEITISSGTEVQFCLRYSNVFTCMACILRGAVLQ